MTSLIFRFVVYIVVVVVVSSIQVLAQPPDNSSNNIETIGIKIGESYRDWQASAQNKRLLEWTDGFNIWLTSTTIHFTWSNGWETDFTQYYSDVDTVIDYGFSDYYFNSGYTIGIDRGRFNSPVVGISNPIRFYSGAVNYPCYDCVDHLSIPDSLTNYLNFSTPQLGSPKFESQIDFNSLDNGYYHSDILHVITNISDGNGLEALHYFRHEGFWSGAWSNPDPWDYPPYIFDTVYNNNAAFNVAASDISGKVALTWMANLPNENDCDTCSGQSQLNPDFDNDLYLQLSYDQGNNWQPKRNLTNYRYNQTNISFYRELSLIIDTDDNLHILTSAALSPQGPLSETPGPEAVLLHWSDATENFNVVALANWDIPDCSVGNRNLNISSISISECDNKLYAMWVQYNDPQNGINDDCSQAGYANGDLWVAVSDDGGSTWGAPINLTQTQSPDCLPGGCLSENWPSMSRSGFQIPQDGASWEKTQRVDPSGNYAGDYYIDVQYVHDKDAGTAGSDEGTQQTADIKWFRLACVEPTNIDTCAYQTPGDVNSDGLIDNTDIDFLENYLLEYGTKPFFIFNADVNADCQIDTNDIVVLSEYLQPGGNTVLADCSCLNPAVVRCCQDLRGNVDGDIDDSVDIADIVFMVEYQFDLPPGPAPQCFDEADINNDNVIDIGDIVYLVEYQFNEPPGPAPVPCQP